MPELPADFDLKLMPDWLKEPPTKNPYADYQGGDEERRPRGREDWGRERGGNDRRGGKPGGGGQRPGGGPRRDDRGRKDAPGGRKPEGKSFGGPSRPDDRRGKPGDSHRAPDRNAPDAREHKTAPTAPANVTIEFFPDESCAISIGRQVKSTHRAYSLFDLARMFLARPERHRLKITTKTVAEPLYQLGENGPVWLDKGAAERSAFPVLRQKYYVGVTEQRDPPKGNFSNVARCRLNGALLGPTNYHGYQPALRKLFEERFSRRMSFSDFQREIEVVNDPALVEQWKQQASSSTVYRIRPPAAPEPPQPAETTAEEPQAPADAAAPVDAPEASAPPAEDPAPAPEASASEDAPAAEPAPEPTPTPAPEAAYDGPVFNTLAEVEQHFRQHFLPTLIRQGSSFHLTGEASRSLTDRGIASAVRQAWEQERGFPGQMMHQLRQQFSRAGLHVFKHRKRMQFVSLIRPSPMEDGSLSPSVAEILQFIKTGQNPNRATLATAILGADEAAIDPARKTTLATDLRWLIETGRVIEFSDGRLELPVVPAKPEPAAKPAPEGPAIPAATETPAEIPTESAPESPAGPTAESAPGPTAELPPQPPAEPAPEPALKEPLDSAPAPEPLAIPEPSSHPKPEPAPAEPVPVPQSV